MTDLIEKLKALTPTEGEWYAIDFAGHIGLLDGDYYEANDLLVADDSPNYLVNGELASLAPQMRTELIRMDEEMKQYKKANEDFEQAKLQWAKTAIKWMQEIKELERRIPTANPTKKLTHER